MRRVGFGIQGRIYSGFGLTVLLSLGLAMLGAAQLRSIAGQIGTYSRSADSDAAILEIEAGLERMNGAALHYRASGDEQSLKDYAAAETSVRDGIAGSRGTMAADRRETLDAITAGLDAYRGKLDGLATLTRQIQADRAKLVGLGDDLNNAANRLMRLAKVDDNAEIVDATQRLGEFVLTIRLITWRFLATTDPKGPSQYEAAQGRVDAALADFDAGDQAETYKPHIERLKAALAANSASFTALADAILKVDALYRTEMAPAMAALIERARNDAAVLSGQLTETRSQTETVIGRTISGQIVIAALILVTAAAAGLGIGRSIARPIIGMTGAMTRLADGDTAVTVPARDRRDQLGAMARAVEVFRRNAVEKLALEQERAALDQQAAEARQRELLSLAATFEAEVQGIVDTVSSGSTDVETAARTLVDAVGGTRRQAHDVADAANLASASVQAAAGAADQLAASITEISRSVTRASDVARTATGAATEADGTMRSLTDAAQRIGDVVSLISTIARQTHLLALNATIEAARAGDAGKGFAVVAHEVKQLADQTARATEDIEHQIGAMQSVSGQAVDSIRHIGRIIHELDGIATGVAASIEEQRAATAEIARNVQQAAQGTQAVTVTIGDVGASARVADESAGRLLSVAGTLTEQADALQGGVGRFLTRVRAG